MSQNWRQQNERMCETDDCLTEIFTKNWKIQSLVVNTKEIWNRNANDLEYVRLAYLVQDAAKRGWNISYNEDNELILTRRFQ